jgi:uncharacterized protein
MRNIRRIFLAGAVIALVSTICGCDRGRAELEKAVSADDVPRVKALLDQGVPPKPPSGDYSLLHIARSKACVDLLVAHGVNVNAATQSGATPLHVAAHLRHLEVVEALLQNGAQVNAMEKAANETPLHWAVVDFPHTGPGSEAYRAHATSGNGAMVDIVEVLLAHGAYPNARDKSGEVPLWNLCDNGSTYAEQVAVAELLLAYGADINAGNNGGQTPLLTADVRSPQFAVWLRAHGAHMP